MFPKKAIKHYIENQKRSEALIRTYKYRLYPNRAQSITLDFLLWQGRKMYNAALEQRINTYKETGKGLSYPAQWAHFRDERHANPDTLGQLNATCVQQMLRRLDKTFKAFFRRVRAGEKPGFPRFKGRSRFRSLEFRHGDGCKLRFDDQNRALLYIQNVGEVKVKYHRPLPDDAEIKHVVVKSNIQKWYVCLQVNLPDPIVSNRPGPSVGIDMGLQSLLAFSDGMLVENPRWLRGSLVRLRVAQRRLSRRRKGSRRRRKAALLVAKLYERISNQRRDFWHKLTHQVVNTYGLIGLEYLTLDFMTSNRYLALSAHDAGLGEFQQLLQYKAEEAGVEVITVNPRNTSQLCSRCGVAVKKNLRVRVHVCPHCGLILDRDVNAARNVLAFALNPHHSWGLNPARTERSEPNVDQWVVRALRSRCLQETE
jgi:putative transposase